MPYEKNRAVSRDAGYLPNTQKFANKELTRNSALSEERHNELLRISAGPTFKPRDQKNKVEKGNLVKIELDGKEMLVIIDEVKLGPNPHIISKKSPLAIAILGEKVGSNTNFKSQNKKSHHVRILEIGTFEDAKEKLFPKSPKL